MQATTVQTISPSRPGGVEKWIPGVRALRGYQRAWLPRDLVAGLVLCALLVPQGMAYAERPMPPSALRPTWCWDPIHRWAR
jgi:hypothetical protein